MGRCSHFTQPHLLELFCYTIKCEGTGERRKRKLLTLEMEYKTLMWSSSNISPGFKLNTWTGASPWLLLIGGVPKALFRLLFYMKAFARPDISTHRECQSPEIFCSPQILFLTQFFHGNPDRWSGTAELCCPQSWTTVVPPSGIEPETSTWDLAQKLSAAVQNKFTAWNKTSQSSLGPEQCRPAFWSASWLFALHHLPISYSHTFLYSELQGEVWLGKESSCPGDGGVSFVILEEVTFKREEEMQRRMRNWWWSTHWHGDIGERRVPNPGAHTPLQSALQDKGAAGLPLGNGVLSFPELFNTPHGHFWSRLLSNASGWNPFLAPSLSTGGSAICR